MCVLKDDNVLLPPVRVVCVGWWWVRGAQMCVVCEAMMMMIVVVKGWLSGSSDILGMGNGVMASQKDEGILGNLAAHHS